jgi:hypothetical protein
MDGGLGELWVWWMWFMMSMGMNLYSSSYKRSSRCNGNSWED